VPLVVDLTAALLAGLLAYVLAQWYARSPATPAHPTEEAARAVGEAIKPHRGLRQQFARRMDREVASGLLLTLALAVTLIGTVILGVLALLVRHVAFIQHIDNSVAAWGYDHRTSAALSGLRMVTEFGNIWVVAVVGVLVVVFDLFRKRSRWGWLFLLVVLAGMELADLGVKDLVGRLRPTLDPAAAALGPSFPSGHSATAAAFWAAIALIVGRNLPRRAQPFFAAAAVAIAVAVAASRVLLDVHWLSDVIGGLALGWAWFALCAVVFGGRLLIPTAAAETVSEEATTADTGANPPPSRRAASRTTSAAR
jgi:undecaprenyl-diphosphatase